MCGTFSRLYIDIRYMMFDYRMIFLCNLAYIMCILCKLCVYKLTLGVMKNAISDDTDNNNVISICS